MNESIFNEQDPVALFFYQFSQGYWEHMEQNIQTLQSWFGG